jgi:hypothetical protein
MKSFIFFIVIVGVVTLLVLNFHVVKTEDGILYVKKGRMTFEDTYVNVIGWNFLKLSQHKLLEEDLIASGNEDLVEEIKSPKKKAGTSLQPPPAPASPPSSSEILLESGSSGSGSGQRLKDKAKSVK